MRIVFLLLVLANLGFLAWSVWIAPPDDGLPPGRVNESMGAGLQLAGETESPASPLDMPEPSAETPAGESAEEEASLAPGDDAEDPDAVVGQAAEAMPPADFRCVALGPFQQRDGAEVARQRLEDQGYSARIREAGGQIRSGFWVYLPPLDSRAAAKEMEARLREKGVQDMFIVTGPENRNAISLGLFSTPDRADQRAAEIGRLGFSPQIGERFRDATVYWLDYREREDDRLEPQSIGVLGVDDLIPEKRTRECGPQDREQAGEGGN